MILLSLWFFFGIGSKSENYILISVKKGLFEISVTTTGELEAKNSVRIMGPSSLRAIGLWRVEISDLVPEGTLVKKGDYIGSLDKSELLNKINDAESELQKAESQFTQTKLDTSLELRQERNELINLEFNLKEKEITLEQSQYEPPATIRQAEYDLEKTKRNYQQVKENYQLKKRKAIAKMQEIGTSLYQAKSKLETMQGILEKFTIRAPKDGMVIYKRDWNGVKKTVGSSVSAWDPTVATLPDLSSMLSRTYINEVDIRKIKTGQQVEISTDAFPDKFFAGKVTYIANVGEQKPNSDAKVFEVTIEINKTDPILKPAMTTGNKIIVETLENVLTIPLECLHNLADTLTYVFKKNGLGFVKQEIKVGQANENETVILRGLNEGEMIYLSVPDEDSKIIFLE